MRLDIPSSQGPRILLVRRPSSFEFNFIVPILEGSVKCTSPLPDDNHFFTVKDSISTRKQFWHFLINGHLDENTGAYANFYTYGSHLGEALSRTIEASGQVDLSNVDVIEAAGLDTID